MTRAALHEFVDRIDEEDIEVVSFVLSRIVRRPTFEDMVFEDDEMTPDEAEAFAEYDAAMARGEQLVPYKTV